MARVATLDIEVYDTTDEWVQAKYLVHGYDDVFWTDDIDAAMQFLEQSMKIAEGCNRKLTTSITSGDLPEPEFESTKHESISWWNL